jgi:hypothetical protein
VPDPGPLPLAQFAAPDAAIPVANCPLEHCAGVAASAVAVPALPVVLRPSVLLKTGVPVNVGLPLSVGEPVKVPDRAAPLMVVAVMALTVMLGVPDSPAAVPVVFWLNVGNVFVPEVRFLLVSVSVVAR